MDERVLRWKARIGSLKAGCVIVLILAAVVVCSGIASLSTALKNSDTPQEVTITQLVNGEVATGRYVQVKGLAFYDLGYEKTENGKTTASYYFVADRATGDMALVKHPAALIPEKQPDEVTITGMTRLPASELKEAMKEDETLFTDNGFRINTALYVEEGARPPTKGSAILMLVLGLVGVGLCLVPFFFPNEVFVPYPVDTTAAPPAEQPRVTATGIFTKLSSVEPLEVGKITRRFRDAIANIVTLGDQELMIYIRYVLKTKTYGITIKTTVTDWGIFLQPGQVDDVTAGKLYGWKDKWAVRFRYSDARNKKAELYIIFDSPGAQAGFVKLLRAMGFSVLTEAE